jgi:succinate-acetate transporter protein
MAVTAPAGTNDRTTAALHERAVDDSFPDGELTAFDEGSGWANSAALALAAFAVCAFMLSMVNAHAVDAAVTPYVWGAALMFGGTTQLIAGIIQLRTGKTFAGVLFSAFGGFWLSLFAIVELFQASVPPAQRGHALGLCLYAFAGFTLYMLLPSFRTNVVAVIALAVLDATLLLLASGNYVTHGALVTAGGWTGLVLTVLAACLSFSAVSEATYGGQVVPVGDLSKG